MRIHGKGEDWVINCTAEEAAMILVSLMKNKELDLEEAILEMIAKLPSAREVAK
jgi:hypothetical protein